MGLSNGHVQWVPKIQIILFYVEISNYKGYRNGTPADNHHGDSPVIEPYRGVHTFWRDGPHHLSNTVLEDWKKTYISNLNEFI